MTNQELAARFTRELLDAVDELAKLGYNATYFKRMLQAHGGVYTARRLIIDTRPSEGLWQLLQLDRLEMSVEMWVLLPWYEPLFDYPLREKARRKLRQLGVDVDAELSRLAQRAT